MFNYQIGDSWLDSRHSNDSPQCRLPRFPQVMKPFFYNVI